MRCSDVEGEQNETFARETLIRYGRGEHIINGVRICKEVDWKTSAVSRLGREERHLTLGNWCRIPWDVQSTSHTNNPAKPFFD